jgi:hypothetical protein
LSASITAWLSLVKLMMDLGLRPALALRDPPATQINVYSLTNVTTIMVAERIAPRTYIGRTPMPVSLKEILGAFEFVSAGGMGEHQAFLCKQSGKIYWHSELSDDLDELPGDIDDSEKYVQIPNKRELDLGKPLVLDFARQFLPDDFDEVRQIFSSRGAYARFKDLLDRRGALDQWYDFEAKAEERALRMWCDLNSIEVGD